MNDKMLDALQSTVELNQKVAELTRCLETMDERLRELDRRMTRVEDRTQASREVSPRVGPPPR